MRKIYYLCCLIIIFVTISVSYAGSFSDVPENHWAYEVITKMNKSGVISGYPDGSFKPNDSISRAEFAKILVLSLSLNSGSSISFEDVPNSHWANEVIGIAGNYMDYHSVGGIKYYYPANNAMREDVTYAIVRALGLENEEYSDSSLLKFYDWYKISENREKYIAIAAEKNLIKGNADHMFNPKGSLTRAEVCQLIENAISYRNNNVNSQAEMHKHVWSMWIHNSKATHMRYCLIDSSHTEQKPHSYLYGYCIDCNYNPSIGHEPTSNSLVTSTAKPVATTKILSNQAQTNRKTIEGDFYYNALTPVQKDIYERIKKACYNYETEVVLDNNHLSDVFLAIESVRLDMPQYYWIYLNNAFSFSYDNKGKVTKVIITIPENAREIMRKTNEKANQVVSKLQGSDYEKVKAIYEWIINNTIYEKSEDDQYMYAVLLNGKAVCAGYAKTFKYLCEKVGIECIHLSGNHDDPSSHAWSAVKLNNKYYWVDVTWGDGHYKMKDGSNKDFVDYNYLLVTDDKFLPEHTLNQFFSFTEGRRFRINVVYPSCHDDSYNYFKMNGCYFEKYDENVISNYLISTLKNGNMDDIEFKFGSTEELNKFNEEFMANGVVFKVIRKALNNNKDTIYYHWNYWNPGNSYCRIKIYLR